MNILVLAIKIMYAGIEASICIEEASDQCFECETYCDGVCVDKRVLQ